MSRAALHRPQTREHDCEPMPLHMINETTRTPQRQSGGRFCSRRAASDERGFALVSVVVVAALIAIIATGLATMVRRLASESAVVTLDAETKAGTEAGLNRIILAYLRAGDPLRTALVPDGRPVAWSFAGKTLTLRAQAESGKLDLNAGDREHIAALLVRLIAQPAEQVRILSDLDAARAARTPFASVAALLSPLDRMGARRDLFESHFTVMTDQRGIDPSTAPPAVLETMPRLHERGRQAILAARRDGHPLRLDTVAAIGGVAFVPERPVYTFRAQTADGFGRAGATQALVGFSENGKMSIYAWAPAGISR
jgi:hypothetical protein